MVVPVLAKKNAIYHSDGGTQTRDNSITHTRLGRGA